MVSSRKSLHLDLTDSVVASAWGIHPCRDISVRRTSDARNVDIAGGVVVASLVATVVDGALGCALGCVDGVRKRHAKNRRVSLVPDHSFGQDLYSSPFRVEYNLATLVGSDLIGAAVEQAVAVGVVVALLAATAEVEAAELLLLLGIFVVVSKMVGLRVADVDAGRANSGAGHNHGATTVGVLLVLLRNLHLAAAGNHLRRCVLA